MFCHADAFAVVIEQYIDVIEQKDVYLPIFSLCLLEDGVAHLIILDEIGSL